MQANNARNHHMVAQSARSAVYGEHSGLFANERSATDEHNEIHLGERLHKSFHACFGLLTPMIAAAEFDLFWSKYMEHEPLSEDDQLKRFWIGRFFGENTPKEKARGKLLFLNWFYLFAKNEMAVMPPEEILKSTEIDRLFDDLMPRSYFKTQAKIVLFGRDAGPEEVKRKLPEVFKRVVSIF
jgi:hypothetical protein